MSTPTREQASYDALYRRAVLECGPTFQSLLWSSAATQATRYSVFQSLAPFAGRRVADMGCGLGDLLRWLEAREIAPAAYVGVELIPEFLEECRTRLSRATSTPHEVIQADFVADPLLCKRLVRDHGVDSFVFCGSLNTLDDSEALAALTRCWASLSEPGATLSFNFLARNAGHAPDTPEGLFRRDSLETLGWCVEQTPMVSLCQYYLRGEDATIVMVKP